MNDDINDDDGGYDSGSLGGCALTVRTTSSRPTNMKICVASLSILWPDSVVEDALTGSTTQWPIPDRLEELLVYKDKSAQTSWEEHGAIRVNRNTMVHLIARKPTQVTVVMDDIEETRAVAKVLINAFRNLAQVRAPGARAA